MLRPQSTDTEIAASSRANHIERYANESISMSKHKEWGYRRLKVMTLIQMPTPPLEAIQRRVCHQHDSNGDYNDLIPPPDAYASMVSDRKEKARSTDMMTIRRERTEQLCLVLGTIDVGVDDGQDP
ncbi:hypothetical protein A7U60_g2767 [Sanghuangporus baumii]|uniref:Uncharacterized protein n=1 Tax=Sanghuangporus baumii TaxID=108892 RepID=A0A9Q5I2F7_SANBA|nr:hypothetical protein A7U60_g2767 [Sanghuangporus baumii]